MVNTVIGIKSAMMDRAGQEDRAMEEYSEELCGILTKIEEAKDMLAQLTDEMDDKDQSTEDVEWMTKTRAQRMWMRPWMRWTMRSISWRI